MDSLAADENSGRPEWWDRRGDRNCGLGWSCRTEWFRTATCALRRHIIEQAPPPVAQDWVIERLIQPAHWVARIHNEASRKASWERPSTDRCEGLLRVNRNKTH